MDVRKRIKKLGWTEEENKYRKRKIKEKNADKSWNRGKRRMQRKCQRLTEIGETQDEED